MTIYAAVDENDTVVVQLGLPDPVDMTGPPEPPPEGPYTYHQIPTYITGRPSEHLLKWSGGATQWVDGRTLDNAKSAKNAEINQKRLEANRTSFAFAGKTIACDELSMLDIASANGIITLTGAMPANWPGGWKAVDNSYVAIPDKATWTAFYGAMVQTGTDNFNRSQTLKASLAAATTNAEVDSITWE